MWPSGCAALLIWTSLTYIGCASTTCSDEAENGLAVTVRDARTGAELCDSKVVATDGAYQETLSNFGAPVAPCYFVGATERAGVYRVDVSHSGYLPKEFDDLRVAPGGPCHIGAPVHLTVDLDPDVGASPQDAGSE